MSGCVYLVGAGPGDPGLLTVKALHLIEDADVIIYDRLISAEIIGLIPTSAIKTYVGKSTGKHSMQQEEINHLLVHYAKQYHKVVRLKGGDPFLYGRGGEEALFLVAHGIPFEVVPGITSASACAAYAGIPLIHRGVASQVQFITGHCQTNKPLAFDWQGLVNPNMTLAIYMGLANLPQIVKGLLDAGRDPATPAALIENGTTTQQRHALTMLSELENTALQYGFTAPVMTIIGEVAALADELQWFRGNISLHKSGAEYTRPELHRSV